MLSRVDNFLKARQERLYELKIQSNAYSNVVYTIKTDKAKYIYKEFKFRNNDEILITSKAGPKIIVDSPVFNSAGAKDDEKNRENCTSFYRIEEYLEHDLVVMSRDYLLIARALGKFHGLNIGGISTFQTKLEILVAENIEMRNSRQKDTVTDTISKIYRRLSPRMLTNEQRLCHMDLQKGNMLKINEEIRFIDFEYACIAHPAIDIANFFCETMTDYVTFDVKTEYGFNKEKKIEFIREYLKTTSHEGVNANKNLRSTSNDFNLYGRVNIFMKEVDDMEVFSHFYWYLWGRRLIISEQTVSKFFDYKKFTLSRLKFLQEECGDGYRDLVEELMRR